MSAGAIRDVRVGLHMTQREFAGLFGLSESRVSRWENQREKPSPHRGYMIDAAAAAIEAGGVYRIAETLAAAGPAYAWHRILCMAFAPPPATASIDRLIRG